MDSQDQLVAVEGEICALVRAAGKRVTGSNCTFVDDDLRLLEHLAQRAVNAGLTDGLHPSVAAKRRKESEDGHA